MNPPDPPLPTVYEAMLTPERLAELLADLEVHAGEVDVRVRAVQETHSDSGRPELSIVGALLDQATGTSVQIRYRFDGKLWCDSILHTAQGYRLVRMELVAPADPQ